MSQPFGSASDNSNLEVKVGMRTDWLDNTPGDEVRVLDAYAGDGHVWAAVAARRPDRNILRVGIEKKLSDDPRVMHGDNMSFLPHIDLETFDAIDLDAHGWPDRQLAVIADRVPHKHVFVTVGMLKMGIVPFTVLEAAGIPGGWIHDAPSLFTNLGVELWDNYVAGLGYRHLLRVMISGGFLMVYDHLLPIASAPVNV